MAYRVTVYFLFFFIFSSAQDMTRLEYISKYKDLAIAEMYKSGIPASITMAQGILESGNGNSNLARISNNHFGIKCHASWKGKKVYHDDDKSQECFRKYSNVKDSYKDHSAFLQTSRYSDLFNLSITDYKSWAKGLKKAGYATNPKYSDLLIKIIEDYQLYSLDVAADVEQRFYHGIAYGWPYIIGQQAIYKNDNKSFLLNGKIEASLNNMYLSLCLSKLLHSKIAFGINFGCAVDKQEAEFLLTRMYGPSFNFLFPYKNNKLLIIQTSLLTESLISFTPTISFIFLR